MDHKHFVGVMFGAFPQPYHRPFIERLEARYAVDVRYARGRWGVHIQEIANELVSQGAEVLVTFDTPSTLAAAHATTTVPTVSQVCGALPDQPVMSNNITGLSRKELDAPRQLGVLLDLLSAADLPKSPVGILWNGDNPAMEMHLRDVRTAAAAYDASIEIQSIPAFGPDFDMRRVLGEAGKLAGLVVLEEPVVVYEREAIVGFASEHRLAAVYESQQLLEVGGLIAYGPDRLAAFSRMADYVDLILDRGLVAGHLPPAEDPPSVLLVNMAVAQEQGFTEIPPILDGVAWAPWTAEVRAAV